MAAIDNARQVGALQRFRPELRANLAAQGVQQRVFHAPRHQHIIRRDARLPRVEGFAENNAARRQRDVRVRGNDGGAFAAQLQRHRRQVFARGGHDAPAHRRAARKEYFIKRQADERLRLRGVAQRDGHMVGRKGLGHHGRQRLGRPGRLRGRARDDAGCPRRPRQSAAPGTAAADNSMGRESAPAHRGRGRTSRSPGTGRRTAGQNAAGTRRADGGAQSAARRRPRPFRSYTLPRAIFPNPPPGRAAALPRAA